MEAQKQYEKIKQKGQQSEHSQKDKHCEHQYLNRKFADLFVQVQFDEELPIKMKGCVLGMDILQHEQTPPPTHHIKSLSQHPNPNPTSQPFAILSYHSLQPNKTLQLLIPLTHIICVARKSSQTTLLMIKDKQNQLQFDQNGYQLVSDSDEDGVEQYEQKTNVLYEKIKKAIGEVSMVEQSQEEQQQQQEMVGGQKMGQQHHRRVVRVDGKCNIMLTPMAVKQHDKSTALQLYNFLSHKLQQHQKITQHHHSPHHTQQWKDQINQLNSFQHMIQMQEQGYEEQQQMEMDDQDCEGEMDQDQDQEQEQGQQQQGNKNMKQ